MEILTDQEAADMLGMKRQTLVNWRHLKKGPPWMKYAGGAVRYDKDELARWQQSQRHECVDTHK